MRKIIVVDTGGRESANLSIEEMPLNTLEQRRYARQNAGSANQGWAQPQDEAVCEYVERVFSTLALSIEE
jgi:hypothetical protein